VFGQERQSDLNFLRWMVGNRGCFHGTISVTVLTDTIKIIGLTESVIRQGGARKGNIKLL